MKTLLKTFVLTTVLALLLLCACSHRDKDWNPQEERVINAFLGIRQAVENDDPELWSRVAAREIEFGGERVSGLELFREFVDRIEDEKDFFERSFDSDYIKQITISGDDAVLEYNEIGGVHRYAFHKQADRWIWVKFDKGG